MLRFFRSSQISTLVVTILIGVVCWMHVWIFSNNAILPDRYEMPFFKGISFWIDTIPILSVFLTMLLTIAEALLLFLINNRLRLIDKISYLPTLCFLLLIGGVPMIHQFVPEAIVSILFILAYLNLTQTLHNDKLSYCYFTAPIFISVATFFYQYAYFYMLVIWLPLLWRPTYWREWVFTLFGFSLPFFLVFSWQFLVNDDYQYIGNVLGKMFSFDRVMPILATSTIVFFSISVLVGVLTFSHLMRYLRSRKLIIRNSYYLLIAILLLTAALTIITPDTLPQLWYIVSFPLAFILSNYLATVRSLRWGTWTLTFLFLGVIATQLIYLFL